VGLVDETFTVMLSLLASVSLYSLQVTGMQLYCTHYNVQMAEVKECATTPVHSKERPPVARTYRHPVTAWGTVNQSWDYRDTKTFSYSEFLSESEFAFLV
jgi:hypothetical protein